jgi:hypothetical protein
LWRDIVHLSECVSVPPKVIVVGENKDIGIYILAMDEGAFVSSFLTFEDEAIAHVVRVVSESVRSRREFHAVSAVA